VTGRVTVNDSIRAVESESEGILVESVLVKMY
jgi:hypothetical protein